jgi:hypothetical protein
MNTLFRPITLSILGIGGAAILLFASNISSSKVLAQVDLTLTTGPTPSPLSKADSWRVPLGGTSTPYLISNGPAEGLHGTPSTLGNLDSREAIDFVRTDAATFPIVAPADGNVLAYATNLALGNILVIDHPSTGSCSFMHIFQVWNQRLQRN